MKKLLSSLAVVTLIGVTSISVVTCDGERIAPVRKTDLKYLKDNVNVIIIEDSVNEFKLQLIDQLKKQSGFSNLEISDVDITKYDGSSLQESDIVQGILNTKVSAKENSQNFTGEKTINVNIEITDTRTDLNMIITEKKLGIIYIGQLDKPNKSEILEIIKDKNIKALALTEDDFYIKKIINTTAIIINGKGNYKNEVTLSCTITNFKKVSSWDESNGAVHALANINGVLYVGTSISGQGNLYKSNSDGKFELMSNWKQGNGAVWSLTNVNGVLYVGTSTVNKKGNLYKINTNDINAKVEPVSNWKDTNGEVHVLVSTNNGDVYVGAKDTRGGKLYKINSSDQVTDLTNWTATNGVALSILNVNGVIYIGTITSNGNGRLYKSDTDDKFNPVSNWKDNNGEVHALANINGVLYVGTSTANKKGNLYKINTNDINAKFEPVSDWKEDNGEIWSLTNINDTIYIGTIAPSNKGNLYITEKK
ncbi:hypothetical protein [Spiroplasma endosymbiont of Thecophora atra]|uniref:hypothetical protein n=1 Tax=Spiroplasma endosymbiont of Thecophora atra TaxID=3066294 RepID=UPI0030D47E1D